MEEKDTKRFWAKVDKSGDCWLWTAAQISFGYGVFRLSGRNFVAHRLSWTLHKGEIPEGLCVLHKCDVPPCVNPEHLFLGTRRENSEDMARKGRHPGGDGAPPGEKHPCAKLTESEVLKIRRLREKGATVVSLAKRFKVGRTTISMIVTRRNWKHI